MICGIGIDITEIERIERVFQRHGMRFVEKILTQEEIESLQKRGTIKAQALAARFAAKEAAAKALGTGFDHGITLKHMALLNAPSGQPYMHFYDLAKTRMQELGANTIHVSITHGRDTACAVVILENVCHSS